MFTKLGMQQIMQHALHNTNIYKK